MYSFFDDFATIVSSLWQELQTKVNCKELVETVLEPVEKRKQAKML